jgi:hypothetical protein
MDMEILDEVGVRFYLEEAKMFTTAVWDIDKLIGQVFAGTIAVTITLLSALAKSVFEDQKFTVPLAYATLAPNVISLVAFYYLISQRRSLVEFGSYVHYIENRLGVTGFQSSLFKIRKRPTRKGESNDPIPYSFWALFLLSASCFGFIIINTSGGRRYLHFIILAAIAVLLAKFHKEWNEVISKDLPRSTRRWRSLDNSST